MLRQDSWRVSPSLYGPAVSFVLLELVCRIRGGGGGSGIGCLLFVIQGYKFYLHDILRVVFLLSFSPCL